MGEQPVVLTDGVVRLRAWGTEDAPAVWAAFQDALIVRFLPIPQPYTEAAARVYVATRALDWASEDERSFAITDATTGDVLGSIVQHLQAEYRAELGYWLAPNARGRGAATRALRLFVDWSLERPGLIRLELCIHPENDASARVAERAGFTREAVRRAWDIDRDGNPEDDVFYVLLRGDPRPAI